ncbi:MAG: hypothetical protein H7Y18_11905 [Clostridiaceae bacterium]|nr:hypothetical protein [Clostridiaceae bacterium]
MKKTPNLPRQLLICALIGILAVVLTIVSDLIMLGKPTTAYSYIKLSTETMVNIPQWRVTYGTFLGVIMLPFQLLGLIPIYYGLKPAGKVKSILMILPAFYAAIIAVGFHISYAFMASGWKLAYKLEAGNLMVKDMLSTFNLYWTITLVIMAIAVTFSSILYVELLRTKKTLFPNWMVFFNPFSIIFCVFLIIVLIPAPVGGFIAPTFLNLSTLIFFTTSLFSRKEAQLGEHSIV